MFILTTTNPDFVIENFKFSFFYGQTNYVKLQSEGNVLDKGVKLKVECENMISSQVTVCLSLVELYESLP